MGQRHEYDLILLGEEIRRIRIFKKKLTISRLSEELGISNAEISRTERGKIPQAGTKRLPKLLEFLGIDKEKFRKKRKRMVSEGEGELAEKRRTREDDW